MYTSVKEHKIITDANGKEMCFIPQGEFTMGCNDAYPEEAPAHKISVKSIYMDRWPVTNREYKNFCDNTGAKYPEDPNWVDMPGYFLNYPDYPVVNVSQQAASSFVAWLGKRLPTEAEWEYAAHGGTYTMYPWGDDEPLNRANYADRGTDYEWRDFRYSDGYKYTSPVCRYQENGYGLYDMCGNVWEYCNNWFYQYSERQKSLNLLDSGWGSSIVARGGCYHSTAYDLRISRRRQVLGGQPQISIGFRCVCDAAEDGTPVFKENITKETGNKASIKEKAYPVKEIKVADGFELCVGVGTFEILEPEKTRRLKYCGVTSIEHYVTWRSVENDGPDNWNFDLWDRNIKVMRECGMKWVPFLIAGPAYSLPDWYRSSPDFHGLKCLEHGLTSKIQSIWDKKFEYYIDRFLAKFAEKYKDLEVIEALLLGICGDFGEAIFPVWHGNWPTQIPGVYHSHEGYWCNDPFARKDYIKHSKEKFNSDINKLNETWGTDFKSFESVTFPELECKMPQGFRTDEMTKAGIYTPDTREKRNRWIDFVDWYRKSMDDYIQVWMECARRHFPNTPIYLCTGGDAAQTHGSFFSSQAKAAAKYGGGVRITNEASKYTHNVCLTNWTAAADAFYGGYTSFEPAGMVNEKGIVCRIFNAFTSGSNLHFYESNIFNDPDRIEIYAENAGYLNIGKPERDICVLYPDVSIILQNRSYDSLITIFELFRDYSDFSFVDDLTIKDGILDRFKVLVLPWGSYYRKDTISQIKGFVEKGGLLVGLNLDEIRCIEEDKDYFNIIFENDGNVKKLGLGGTLNIKEEIRCSNGFYNPVEGTALIDYKLEHDTDYYQTRIFDKITRFVEKDAYIPDGHLDGVYISEVDGDIYALNNTVKDLQSAVKFRNGEKTSFTIKENSIKKFRGVL